MMQKGRAIGGNVSRTTDNKVLLLYYFLLGLFYFWEETNQRKYNDLNYAPVPY